MAISKKRNTIYAKVGFILNDWLGENLPVGSDLDPGFTAIAGETAGEWDLFIGLVSDSTSSVPENNFIS